MQRNQPNRVAEVPRTHLLVVVQTHSLSNSQGGTRYCEAPKAEVTRRCVRSLAMSIDYARKEMPGIEIDFRIFDDRSDPETVAILESLGETVQTREAGLLASLRECYEYGHAEGKQLVYFAQDDYLHAPSAIMEMVEHFFLASGNLGRWCALYPFDDPYRYMPHNIVPVEVVLGKRRHWRRNYKTACCFMVHQETLKEHWDLFDAMCRHEIDSKMEDETINRLFSERGVVLMTPIPSLALHLQFETERDPFIDWRSWWEAANWRCGTKDPETGLPWEYVEYMKKNGGWMSGSPSACAPDARGALLEWGGANV